MPPNRRSFLVSVGSVALAGCLGGNGTGGDESVESLPPPVMGEPAADVTVMVFADFACPHCAHFETEVLPRIEATYVEPGRVRYEHRDFPIPVDERWSWAVANAARSVQDAGDDEAFFRFSKACFANQGAYTLELLGRLAADVGLSGDRVIADARNGTYRPVIEADRALGVELELHGTPGVYVNRTRLPAYDYATVSAAIDEAE